MYPRLFGTDGVRGIVNKDFTPFFALKLGLAIGSYFGPGARILIGRDARVGNAPVLHAVLSGLTATGVKVYDAGVLPTPALQLSVRDFGFDGGVVVTASHNPPEYSGVKVIMSDGIEAPRNVEEEIERMFHEEKFRYVPWSSIGSVQSFPRAIEHYVESVVKRVDAEAVRKRGFKVVADCANSGAALTTPAILKKLGAKVLSINCDFGTPYRSYEPTPENLEDTVRIVRAVEADLAVAHDADADRAIFIDRKGRVIPGDVSAVMLIYHIAEKNPDLPRRIVTPVSTSHFLMDETVVKKGIEVVWTAVGFIKIARKIQEIGGAIAGFEDNGGFAYPKHQLVRDGGMSTALMLEALAKKGAGLDALYDSIPKPAIVRTKVPVSSREVGLKAVEMVRERFSGYRRIEIDGVKIFAEDWAALVRMSGTEPIVRIMAESPSEEKAMKVAEELKNLVASLVAEVTRS